MKLRETKLRQLLYWMEERQRIYLKRQAGEPWPWTKDEVLRQFRFCNTYREQDRETVWLREHWLKPYADHPNLWFAVALFRQINWSPTLEELGFPETWDPARVESVMEARKERGDKLYTSAYMLPSHGEISKAHYTVYKVLDSLWQRVVTNSEALPWQLLWGSSPVSLRQAHAWLCGFYSFGGFLAYEVVTDWRHTRYLENAPDIYTWANPGPGAKKGLCRLLGIAVTERLTPAEQLEYMRQTFMWIDASRDRTLLPTLEMRDIEHSLCELQKYLRVKEALAQGGSYHGGLEKFRNPLVAVHV